MFRLITTGYFYADGGAMFGAVPKVSWNRCYPANERNLCVLAMHTGVITTKDKRVIVVDPGVGKDRLNKPPATYYQFYDTRNITEALQREGIATDDVTDVIFTHLHFDHCGAAVQINDRGIAVPVFGKANHWVSRAQYESEKTPHPLEADSFLPDNTSVIEAHGLLRMVESAIQPYESLRIDLQDGHTLGQIVAAIKPDNTDISEVVFPGDILPLACHIVPERISAYDLYPALSYFGKISLLDKAVREQQMLVYYHDAHTPCSLVKKAGRSYRSQLAG